MDEATGIPVASTTIFPFPSVSGTDPKNNPSG